jgi:protein gp37
MSTKIEWADETWSPVTGCTPISEGCKNCYARRMSKRLAGRFGYPKDEPFRVTTHPDKLEKPFHWKKPRRIFVVSMGDLFHGAVSFEYIAAVFGVMAANPQHMFLVLTKRPHLMLRWLESTLDTLKYTNAHAGVCDYLVSVTLSRMFSIADNDNEEADRICELVKQPKEIWPLPNVHLGVSVENQAAADERIPLLLQTPAAKRFISIEPMLGAINLRLHRRNIDQVIVGAETGPGKRHMSRHWARSIRDQCITADVPFFFKKDALGDHKLDGKIWEELPEYSQVRTLVAGITEGKGI